MYAIWYSSKAKLVFFKGTEEYQIEINVFGIMAVATFD
jgi:hypothetical protein